MRQLIGQRPTADLGAVELESMQAQGFGSHKAVRAWGVQPSRLRGRSKTGGGQGVV
jgi:hypothetical protein